MLWGVDFRNRRWWKSAEETFKRKTEAHQEKNQLNYGNKHKNATEHPQTKSNLISDPLVTP